MYSPIINQIHEHEQHGLLTIVNYIKYIIYKLIV